MTSTSWLCTPRSFSLLAALVATSACTSRDPGEETDSDGTTTTGEGPATDGPTSDTPTTNPPTTTDPTEGPTSDGTTTEDEPEQFPTVPIEVSIDADILFVVDNSASMAGKQAKLAAGMSGFVAALGDLNYRIGITTTDSGNPTCNVESTTPERGALVLSSCVDRVAAGEFEIPGVGDDVSFACTDACALSDADLPITPTATHVSDGAMAPRKWIERRFSATNLPDGVSPAQALQCFIPQGVAGCGFESHLESMFLAVDQASDANSANFGFVRPNASLSVVFVSDETDCSPVPAFDDIFSTNKVFWEDPQGPAPTSAACWNAGVSCDGAGPLFADCLADNHDAAGEIGVADDKAVLQPLARYVDLLQVLEDEKRTIDPFAEVRVMMIAGVPIGYESHDAEIVYEDAADPEFQETFGIGPGCLDAAQSGAVPPVREREVAEAFAVGDVRDVHSICANDYTAALASIGSRIAEQIRPMCMPVCVADVDADTPTVEVQCEVFEVDPVAETRIGLPPCVEQNGNWTVPEGVTACFAALTDAGGFTPSKSDDMAAECVAEGFNLEFTIIRTGLPGPGVRLEATCVTADNPAQTCPML